jgi:hypothetical protein
MSTYIVLSTVIGGVATYLYLYIQKKNEMYEERLYEERLCEERRRMKEYVSYEIQIAESKMERILDVHKIYELENAIQHITQQFEEKFEQITEKLAKIELNISALNISASRITDESCIHNLQNEIQNLNYRYYQTMDTLARQVSNIPEIVLIGYRAHEVNYEIICMPIFVPNHITLSAEDIHNYGLSNCSIIVEHLKYLKNVKTINLDDFSRENYFIKNMSIPLNYQDYYKNDIILNMDAYHHTSNIHNFNLREPIKNLRKILSNYGIHLMLNNDVERMIRDS